VGEAGGFGGAGAAPVAEEGGAEGGPAAEEADGEAGQEAVPGAGGIDFTGGEGGVIGALAGSLFLLALLNVATISSLNPFTQLIVQGVVMLIAVFLFQLLKKRTRT